MKYSKKKYHQISLTAAMADMALLLLVFFMTATSMAPQKTEEIDLPEANAEIIDQNHIFISITKEEEVLIDNRVVSLDELYNILSTTPDALDKKIVIMGDRTLSYGSVSKILGVTKSLGLLDVVFLSKVEE